MKGSSQAPPSAPKQGNFIQFEEVKDAANQYDEVVIRREDAYEMYGRSSADVGDADTPSLTRE